jgi:hypothetical protein
MDISEDPSIDQLWQSLRGKPASQAIQEYVQMIARQHPNWDQDTLVRFIQAEEANPNSRIRQLMYD